MHLICPCEADSEIDIISPWCSGVFLAPAKCLCALLAGPYRLPSLLEHDRGLPSYLRPALLFWPLLLGTYRDLGGRYPEFRRLQEKKVSNAYRRPESRPK